jgi:hypothetical protein
MDRVTPCLHCWKRIVPAPSSTRRTELLCVVCDKLDPIEIVEVKKWAGGPPRPTYLRDNPLNELCRSKPSEVMSRYSTSATKDGSTHVAFGLRMALVSSDFGLSTISSCFLI